MKERNEKKNWHQQLSLLLVWLPCISGYAVCRMKNADCGHGTPGCVFLDLYLFEICWNSHCRKQYSICHPVKWNILSDSRLYTQSKLEKIFVSLEIVSRNCDCQWLPYKANGPLLATVKKTAVLCEKRVMPIKTKICHAFWLTIGIRWSQVIHSNGFVCTYYIPVAKTV